ncbi:MAG TPA: helicase-associated domain-containing protein [Isosphaeraceae bacterium]
MPDPTETTAFAARPPELPTSAYRAALQRYDQGRLLAIHRHSGGAEVGTNHKVRPDWIVDRLAEPRAAERLLGALATASRTAMGLFTLTESHAWTAPGMSLALTALGIDPDEAVYPLLERGLLALRDPEPAPNAKPALLLAHPAATAAARTIPPEGDGPVVVTEVRQVREADGLEPILRMAAVWQRVAEAPLRQTQHGTFFKRDRERIEDDPVVSGPISDAFERLTDMALLWIALATSVGLLSEESGTDRVVAAPPEFWAENAVHLPQMAATRWLALHEWHEQGGMVAEGSPVELALPHLRPVVLLWLARLGKDEWIALDDLAAHLDAINPGWHHPTLPHPKPVPPGEGSAVLASILLGPAYQLGLVRTAEEVPSGGRVVQLTPLGCYVLALGPPPGPRPTFEHFLFVQPNFEVVAYRQGLTPGLIGEFSRFARWSQIGAALELKLTPESVYQGLEGGLTPEAMLDRLTRHSARPIPPSVDDAVRTWASRRERVTYYGAATLVEFTDPADLERALAAWDIEPGTTGPIRISERLLLVEDANSIPFGRFRLAGSRDYRRQPEPCVEIEPDGVTLALDLGRSDLLVDAELARFADELPPAATRRRFRVSPESLARALDGGRSVSSLTRWFHQRSGTGLPAAIRLLLHAAAPEGEPIAATRPLVLSVPSESLLDGLLQHPETAPYLGDRLGPTAVVVVEPLWPRLREVLDALGLPFIEGEGSPRKAKARRSS